LLYREENQHDKYVILLLQLIDDDLWFGLM